MTRLAIYLRPVRGEPCRCARGRSAYLFVCWPRAAAIARRQHDEFVVRPCDAKDFSILDTHSTRHGTLKPYLSTMFIRDDINRLVASFFVVGNYSTSHRRYSVFAYLSPTNVHGPVNHFALSQFVPLPKHSLSVSGLSLGLQNNSLTSAQATCLVSTPLPHSAEHWTKDKRTFSIRFDSISPSFLSIYRSYLGRPFRVEPRRSLLHTSVRSARRGFAHFLRFGFVERRTDTSR